MISRKGFAVLAAVLVIAAVSCGCVANLGREPGWGKPTTLDFTLQKDVKIPERPVVIFLCDGLRKETFDQMLAAGELPSIKHFLVDRGVFVENAVTSLPTVTYAVISSYATGRYPGHAGILGNKWFDPAYLVSQDYTEIDTMGLVNDDILGPTLYELLDREKSCVVLSQINRGCSRFHENWMVAGVSWFFGMFRNVSMSTTARLQDMAAAANKDKRWPELVTLYYPATDEVAHRDGVDAPQYREMIKVFDNEVGDACKAFEKEGLLERLMLVVITDHGMTNTPRHCNVPEALTALGANLYTKKLYELPAHYWARAARFADPDVVALVDSYRLAKLYFRLPGLSWNHRPTLEEIRALGAAWRQHRFWGDPPKGDEVTDLVKRLAGLEGVKFAVHSDRGRPETRVHIINTVGTAVITRHVEANGKVYRYEVTGGQDPLGYTGVPVAQALIDGKFHSADEWLATTIGTEHPDFVSQLTEMFESTRSGDLALFAKPGWDFSGHNKGGHGGLAREETIVPMIIAAPGLPAGERLPYARTLALAPTVYEQIRGNKPAAVFEEFDCDSLLDKLRAAGKNVPSGTKN